jgi:hypothetical protein
MDRDDRMDPRDRETRDRYDRDRDRDWRDREVRERVWREREERRARQDDPLEDYGQADFSRDYAYDPDTRTGYRLDPKEQARRRYEEDTADQPDRYADERRYEERRHDDVRRMDERYERDRDDERRPDERRSWAERAGLTGLFGGGGRTDRRSDDRVLWVVATEALHRARGLDDSDIHVRVEDAIVVLEGSVRSREDKRRAEDLVEQRGVRDVHNHLRIRERRWGF